jgi:hypothetical protein
MKILKRIFQLSWRLLEFEILLAEKSLGMLGILANISTGRQRVSGFRFHISIGRYGVYLGFWATFLLVDKGGLDSGLTFLLVDEGLVSSRHSTGRQGVWFWFLVDISTGRQRGLVLGFGRHFY